MEEEEVVILEQDPSTLIAKPAGEAGRPNRGGYTLNDVLKESGWSEKHITLFKDKVKECADAHLDTSAPYTRQEQAAMRDFKAAMMDEWKAGDGGRRGLPDLADYAHMWPLTDQVKAYLKYSSTKSAKKKKAKDR
ncbi:hypothetical protein B0H21DRAFT_580047 [Amylocystis lapponica]|nr:hypothetical protein B0H21DRAFT_580047 [Amylocystis lapponica]